MLYSKGFVEITLNPLNTEGDFEVHYQTLGMAFPCKNKPTVFSTVMHKNYVLKTA